MARNDPGERLTPREEGTSDLREALLGKLKDQERAGGTAPALDPDPAPRATIDLPTPAAQPAEGFGDSWSLGGPNNLERAVFCRQLATLIEVGIPVLKAFQMLAVRTSHPRLRVAIRSAAQGIEQGQSIHQAMAGHARVFSPMVVNIVRIGETGGILEGSLARLADIMESKARIKRRIVSASMYPMVALLVAVAVVMLIMVKAIPAFADAYSSFDKELPQLTQLIIDISNFLKGAWWIIILLIVLGIWGLKMWARTSSGSRVFSFLALRLPIFSGINKKIAVARSTRTLGSLLTAGIPLIDALGITADTNENVLVADALRDVRAHVQKGERMADPLRRADVFPPMVVDMLAIGEETGTLDTMLAKVADIYDVEVDATLNGLSSIIEPVLIIVLGLIVVFIALAVLLPYFNLANVI